MTVFPHHSRAYRSPVKALPSIRPVLLPQSKVIETAAARNVLLMTTPHLPISEIPILRERQPVLVNLRSIRILHDLHMVDGESSQIF